MPTSTIKLRSRSILAIYAALAVWGCDTRDATGPDGAPERQEIALIAGGVVDATTLKGIPGAVVDVTEVGTTTTEGNGNYAFSSLRALPPTPRITIRAEARGYIAASIEVDLREKPLRIPAVKLTRLAPPQKIGPSGGVVTGTGSASIRVPAGAVDHVTSLTLTSLPITAEPSGRGRRTILMLAAVHVGPENVHFAMPVRVTLRLWKSMAPDSRLRVVREDGSTTANADDVAVVSADGLSATFSTTMGGAVALTSSSDFVMLESAPVFQPPTDRTPMVTTYPCTDEVVHTGVIHYNTNLVKSFPDAKYASAAGPDIDSRIGNPTATYPSIAIYPPVDGSQAVEFRAYFDTYRVDFTIHEVVFVNNQWVQVGPTRNGYYQYQVLRLQTATGPCHDQGQTN